MLICIEKDYTALSERAARIIIDEVNKKPDCVLGLATGSTPVGTYELLAKACAAGEVSFKRVRTVNLDEYAGLSPDDVNSYRRFMNEQLFSKIDIDIANTNVPNGMAADMAAECKRYDALIESMGGIDLQLLGIGRNGHIGFNEPSEQFSEGTHEVVLTPSTREANGVYFGSADAVPRTALTMGTGSIMRAKKVLLIASGKLKRDAVRSAVYGPVTPAVPASALQEHGDAVVICDFEIN